jgi:hypothetical protein
MTQFYGPKWKTTNVTNIDIRLRSGTLGGTMETFLSLVSPYGLWTQSAVSLFKQALRGHARTILVWRVYHGVFPKSSAGKNLPEKAFVSALIPIYIRLNQGITSLKVWTN